MVRADLPPGSQAVQAMHAMRQFAEEHPEEEKAWFRDSNYLAFLQVHDEEGLRELLRDAEDRGIPASFFREPDLEDSMTAIALHPSARRLCGRLKLALSG